MVPAIQYTEHKFDLKNEFVPKLVEEKFEKSLYYLDNFISSLVIT